MNSIKTGTIQPRHYLLFCLFGFLILVNNQASAQEDPPKPITVTVSISQHLSFGNFIQNGNSGTVTVNPQGVRSSTGSIILPTMFSIVTPSLFDVEALPGTLITISNGPDVQLTSSGGGIITLQIGEASTGPTFITSSQHTNVSIGGTLIVGPLGSNPPGDYGGSFNVTFIQE